MASSTAVAGAAGAAAGSAGHGTSASAGSAAAGNGPGGGSHTSGAATAGTKHTTAPSVFERLASAKKKPAPPPALPSSTSSRPASGGISNSASVGVPLATAKAPAGSVAAGKTSKSNASLSDRPNQRPVAIGSLQRKLVGPPGNHVLPKQPPAAAAAAATTASIASITSITADKPAIPISGSTSPHRTSLSTTLPFTAPSEIAKVDDGTSIILSARPTSPKHDGILLPPKTSDTVISSSNSNISSSPKRSLPSTAVPPSQVSSLSSKIAAAAAASRAPVAIRAQTAASKSTIGLKRATTVVGRPNTNEPAQEEAIAVDVKLGGKSNMRSTSAPAERARRITFAPDTKIDSTAFRAKSMNKSTPSIQASTTNTSQRQSTATPASSTVKGKSTTTVSSTSAKQSTPLPSLTTQSQDRDDPPPSNSLYPNYIPAASTSYTDDDSNSYQIPQSHIDHLKNLEATISDQSKRIEDLEHQLKEAERKEQNAVKEKQNVVKELEQLKKYMATDYKTVEQLKTQLQEEHTTNASLIIFNRSLKTQLAEMEVIIDNLMQAKGGTAAQLAQAAMARIELESLKGLPPPIVKK
ncbi:hypothetical protein HDU97_003077 [Phlyctochytrium planicorne]|nr:hypothetical protein HDU97_003077 [Phlyctochytrium planicorne]